MPAMELKQWMKDYLKRLNGLTIPALVDEVASAAIGDGEAEGYDPKQSWKAEQSRAQLKLRFEILASRLSQEPAPREPNVMSPSLSLLTKLASIVVHTEEAMSPGGHPFDLDALRTLLRDPELKDWMKRMGKLSLLPEKRP